MNYQETIENDINTDLYKKSLVDEALKEGRINEDTAKELLDNPQAFSEWEANQE